MFPIEELRGRVDPQLGFTFKVLIPDISRRHAILMSYVESVTFSYPDIAVDIVSFQNTYLKYAGRINNPPVAIEFYEDKLSTTQRNLQAWRHLIRNFDGTYNYPSQYKKNIEITILDGQKTEVSKVILENAFPSNSNPIRLSYGDGGRVLVGQTFEIEHIYILDPLDGQITATASVIE